MRSTRFKEKYLIFILGHFTLIFCVPGCFLKFVYFVDVISSSAREKSFQFFPNSFLLLLVLFFSNFFNLFKSVRKLILTLRVWLRVILNIFCDEFCCPPKRVVSNRQFMIVFRNSPSQCLLRDPWFLFHFGRLHSLFRYLCQSLTGGFAFLVFRKSHIL